MHIKIGSIANYLAALGLLTGGILYLFTNSFMPYHSEALSLEWNEVEHSTQFLILAMMRVVAGGWITTAFVIAFLQSKFISSKIPWIPLLILIAGLIECIVSIYGTLIVRLNTPGKPPTTLVIIYFLELIIGYIFNRKAVKQ